MIIGVRQDANFRSSVGVANCGSDGRSFRIEASSPSGSFTKSLFVPGGSVSQWSLPTSSLGYMTVFVYSDGGKEPWAAFASSVDNRSGDSWLVNGVTSSATRKGAASLLVPISGSGPGAGGTFWQTDLSLTNHRSVPQTVMISFNYEGQFFYGPAFDVEVVLPADSTTTFENVVKTLFGTTGTGVIFINATFYDGFAEDADLSATYRIWTNSPDTGGTASQSSAALDATALSYDTDPKTIIGAREDDDFRCNVGVVSYDYYDRTFRITASSPAGSVSTTAVVKGYSVAQVALPPANLGYVTIVVESMDGVHEQWAAFASTVDNHTGDSWLVDAIEK
jgi:hypothetical protein